MKKQLAKKLIVSTCALALAAAPIASYKITANAAPNAMGYELGFATVATLDFTDASMIQNPKDESRTATKGVLRYFDYADDLLSIVDDANAKSGKAVQVATAQDFPRTKFDVESNVLYKFSYKIKMTDESKWQDSLGISPYINFGAANEGGEVKADQGHDFHRDYADVVYAYSDNYKTTEFYFATTQKGERMTINLYDTLANAKEKNERDSYKFDAGYINLDYFEVAFYTQGGSKTMPYQISDIELSAYSVISGETSTPLAFTYDIEDELSNEVVKVDFSSEDHIVADASSTDSASNPGKVVVNGKSDFIFIVDDADTSSGKALQVQSAQDYPRIRFNTLQTGKPYMVSYKIKMTDESKWPAEGGSLGITPYLNFTAYSPEAKNWQPDNGFDFHCGYKDVQYSYNNNYATSYFIFETEVVENKLVLNLYGDAIGYQAGIPAATFTFNEGFVELAAVDFAFYVQGSAKEMAYRIADITVSTLEEPVVEPPVEEPPVDEPPVENPPVDEPPVDQPTDSGNTGSSGEEKPAKSGCGSVVSIGMPMVALCGLAVVALKRKQK